MGNPIDEYLSHGQEKQANFGQAMARGATQAFSGEGLGKLVVQTGLVAGATALIGAARKAYGAATKSTDYRTMMDLNPDLGEHQERDPRMFNQHYTSLRNLNPTFASDPVVAGSYMRQMSEFPHNAGSILVQSIQSAPRNPQSRLKDFTMGLDVAERAQPPRPPRQALPPPASYDAEE